MSRLFRAGAVPALSLSLILLGTLSGCGGNADEAGDGGALPPAEPGQTTIPDTGAGASGSGDQGGTADIPVDQSPADPGTGS